jgi:eukaryotic-like serine/threonine-protein kinase
VLARLNHPNIASIYGLEKSDGTAALVMELVEGPTLADRIAQGPIPVDDVLALARQIAEALETAHEHGIIHRDLKPSNIKLRPDGAVKVLDFGLAKAMDGPLSGSSSVSMSPTITTPAMTQAGVILGTAAYMSPEQASGGEVDGRADLYSLACLLFEMLGGEPPFTGTSAQAIIARRFGMPPPSVRKLRAEVPDALDGVIRRALALDPAERFANGTELAHALALRVPEQTPEPNAPAAPRSELATWVSQWLVPLVLTAIAGLLGQSMLAR